MIIERNFMNRLTWCPALVLALALPITGCGSEANGDKAAFCKTNLQIDAATANIHSEADAVAAFTKAQPMIRRAVRQAPDAVKADADTMAKAADHALSTKDFSAFENVSLDAPSKRIEKYCS
jgi:hypothetical protein